MGVGWGGGGPRISLRSRGRRLLASTCPPTSDRPAPPPGFAPAPTAVSRRSWPRAAATACPGSPPPSRLARASAHRPTAWATGTAGDLFLCHPFLVRAASSPHHGRSPKMMAQPPVLLTGGQFPWPAARTSPAGPGRAGHFLTTSPPPPAKAPPRPAGALAPSLPSAPGQLSSRAAATFLGTHIRQASITSSRISSGLRAGYQRVRRVKPLVGQPGQCELARLGRDQGVPLLLGKPETHRRLVR